MGIIVIREITVQKSKVESVRNADRKCKAKTNFAACGQNLGVYTAKPPVSVWVPRWFLDAEMAIFLKLTPMLQVSNRTYWTLGRELYPEVTLIVEIFQIPKSARSDRFGKRSGANRGAP